jgi:hypothetical protein
MMVPAGREKRGLVTESGGEPHAEHALVEAERPGEVRHLEVHVPEVRAGRHGVFVSVAHLWSLLLVSACAAPERPPLLTVERIPLDSNRTRLVLTGEPGARINARLRPALERADGTILRFDPPAADADSSYYSEAPELILEGESSGTVVASVCPTGEKVCRKVEVPTGE